jgi:hypothetical protein
VWILERRNVHKILVENPEGRENMVDLGVDGRILMHLKEIGCVVMDWIQLAHDEHSIVFSWTL